MRPSGRASSTAWTPRPPGSWWSPRASAPTPSLKAAFKERTVDQGLPRARAGPPRSVARHHRRPDRPAPPARLAVRRRLAAAGPRSPTTRCSRPSRRRAWSTSGWRPAAPTRSGCTSPPCGTPASATLTYGADPTLAARLGVERQWLHAVRLGFAAPGRRPVGRVHQRVPARPRRRAGRPARRGLTPPCRERPARLPAPTSAPPPWRRSWSRATWWWASRSSGTSCTGASRGGCAPTPGPGGPSTAGCWSSSGGCRCSSWSSGWRRPDVDAAAVGLRWPQQWPGAGHRRRRRARAGLRRCVSTRALRGGALLEAAPPGAGRPGEGRHAEPPAHATLALLPRTPAERRLFTVVGVTAGVCEEWLYRGFFLAVVAALAGGPVDLGAGRRRRGRLRAGARLPGPRRDRDHRRARRRHGRRSTWRPARCCCRSCCTRPSTCASCSCPPGCCPAGRGAR